LQRRLGFIEALPSERKVGRPPKGAGQPPPIAGTTEHRARLGQVALCAPVIAGFRADQTEPGEHQPSTAPIALSATQLECLLEGRAGRRMPTLGELEIGAPHEHGRRTTLVP
jgi:hypothetical protein